MSPSNVLTRVLILALAMVLLWPTAAVASEHDPDEDDQSDEPDDRPGPDDNRSEERSGRSGDDEEGEDENETDDNEGEDENETDGGGQGRGRGRDRDRDRDRDDDEERRNERAVSQDMRRQVGRFQMENGGIDGRFVSFTLADGGVSDFAYRNHTFFTTIGFDPALEPDEIRAKGAQYHAEGDDAEFKAVDTPSAHFKAEADDGTITLVLASGTNATFVSERGGHGNEKIRLGSAGITAFVHGEDLALSNGTITSSEEVRFIVHAPALRGHLASQIGAAAEGGRLAGEVLVPNGTGDEDEPVAVPYGPYNLSVERGARNVTVTIEGHGNGSTLLFDLERGAIGGIDDLVILFDGERIHAADDLDDVLNTTADEAPEYLILVGGNKTQVLVSIPHFSVHTIQLSSAGPVALIQPLLGSPLVAVAAAAVAAVFVGVTIGIRNRQR